jgi:hypothetical protein
MRIVAKAGYSLALFFFWILERFNSLWCDGLCRCHDTCSMKAWMGFGHNISLSCPIFDYSDLLCDQKNSRFFLAEVVWIFFSIFQRPTVIRVDAVDMLWIFMLSIIIVMRWSRSFIVLGCFSLLLKFAKKKDHRFTDFGKIFILLCDCLRPFPDRITLQRFGM